jgi:hypothetical protein
MAETEDELRAELEKLKAENEALKGRSEKGLTLKVSQKGAVSVYGLGRFPVTLYKEQWGRLLEVADEIRAFIKENDDKLKSKN